MDAFHGLVEVLQPIVVPVDIEERGFVEEPVEDSGGRILSVSSGRQPGRIKPCLMRTIRLGLKRCLRMSPPT